MILIQLWLALLKLIMYLHQFKNPKIVQYDSLSQDERWADKFDIILANPPFMSPKGGIKPHSKFSISSNRSEVLFVDYIVNHLKPNGRSGIIVPEGIIFQSGIAYKTLRKNLIADGLYAVISLPSGVFQPYSGVKTSILLIDKEFAKKSNEILFIKIENDGFDLGAQRRVNVKNDLPQALEILQKFKNHFLLESPLALTTLDLNNSPLEVVTNARSNHPPVESVSNIRCNHPHLDGGSKLQSNFGEGSKNFLLVPKSKIAENGDYNLSGDRYRIATDYSKAKWEMVELGEIVEILDNKRKPITKCDRKAGQFPYYGATGILDYVDNYIFDERLVLIGEDGAKWNVGDKTAFIAEGKYWVNNHAHVVRPIKNKIIDTFLVEYLNSIDLSQFITGVTVPKLNQEKLRSIKIPLPPLEIQEQIVSEVEGYSAIISGAKQIVANWKPKIDIDPSWEMVKLGDVCEINPKKSKLKFLDPETEVSFIPMSDLSQDESNFEPLKTKKLTEVVGSYTYFAENDVLLARVSPCFENGKAGIARKLKNKIGFGSSEYIVLRPTKIILPEIAYTYITQHNFNQEGKLRMTGTGDLQRVPIDFVVNFEIPLPPLETQQQIVSQIEAERALVESAKKLIEIYEQKTKAVINKLWEE